MSASQRLSYSANLRFGLVAALLCSALATLVLTTIVHAATTISVTSTADSIANDGVCTLREAIIATNTQNASGATAGECPAGTGTDTIMLPAGTYTLTISGHNEDNAATGDLDIKANTTIAGAGQSTTIIDGNQIDRVFDIFTGFSVTISDLTVRNGSPSSPFNGAGIQNRGTLSLTHVSISDNVNGPGGIGGGIYNEGALTLNTCTVSGNIAEGNGAGIASNGGSVTLNRTSITGNTISGGSGVYGAGIYASGTLTIVDSTISNNSDNSGSGGGISSSGPLSITDSTVSNNTSRSGGGGGIASTGGLTLTGSTISGNTAQTSGGGIALNGTATITDSIVTNNTSSTNGGGIEIQISNALVTIANSSIGSNTGAGIDNGGILSISRSTISGNTVSNGNGGGIANTHSLSITESTISGNSAGNGGGIYNTVIASRR
jgi:CSLREA domain-containing protein